MSIPGLNQTPANFSTLPRSGSTPNESLGHQPKLVRMMSPPHLYFVRSSDATPHTHEANTVHHIETLAHDRVDRN